MFRESTLWVGCGLGILLLPGCFSGKNVGVVTGQVLVDGEPTGGYEVEFIAEKDGVSALGLAMEDGKYQLVKGRGERRHYIPVGEYKVIVSVASPPVEGIPRPKFKPTPKYHNRDETVLHKTISPGENHIDLELETAG